jgi:hypothetical protein
MGRGQWGPGRRVSSENQEKVGPPGMVGEPGLSRWVGREVGHQREWKVSRGECCGVWRRVGGEWRGME